MNTYANLFKPIRWGDNDHFFGPFTYAKRKWSDKPITLLLGSGDGGDYPRCRLRFEILSHTLILALPPIIKPWRKKIIADSWDAATVERLGRNWYWDTYAREYGFSYYDGFLNCSYGRQTQDSSTEQRKGWFVPFANWRFVRHSFYDLSGNHFWTEPKRTNNPIKDTQSRMAAEESCPKQTFLFTDYDGEKLSAETRIEEREWRFGTGWFKWLSLFCKPKIGRSLDIKFSSETGKRKGSWKGGTIGHSIQMLPNELHEAAFRRYCEKHEMTFEEIKPVEEPIAM